MWFEPYHKMDRRNALDASNYVIETNSETCKGCGLCVKRCPMEVLELNPFESADRDLNKKAQVPVLVSENCIGCGVCVHKCSTKSLKLVLRDTINDPPKTAIEWTKDYWRVLKQK